MDKITGQQCRAARAWLGIEARELAAALGINRDTLSRFERGAKTRNYAHAIRELLEGNGIRFIFSEGVAIGIASSDGVRRALDAQRDRINDQEDWG